MEYNLEKVISDCLNCDETILVACEASQEVTIALREKGFNAFSCDLEPCYGGHPEWHLQMDAIKALWMRKWQMVIAHPPCTRLANSGVRWLTSRKEREGYSWSDNAKLFLRDDPRIWEDFYDGCRFFKQFVLYGQTGGTIMIENPVQHKYAIEEINRRYDQAIQPWEYGHTTTKATCLWLFGLPPLNPTNIIPKEQRTQDIWLASPGPDRARLRSKTFTGIAKAIADQYGDYLLNKH